MARSKQYTSLLSILVLWMLLLAACQPGVLTPTEAVETVDEIDPLPTEPPSSIQTPPAEAPTTEAPTTEAPTEPIVDETEAASVETESPKESALPPSQPRKVKVRTWKDTPSGIGGNHSGINQGGGFSGNSG